MSSLREFRATRTRALATTAVDPRSDVRTRSDLEGSEDEDSQRRFDQDALPQIGDVVGGHYELVSKLGEGNFGRVYLAERVDVREHHVALKIMSKALYAGRNVERELVMLATVGHPNMVQLKDHGMTATYVWFTMPVYEGETLGARLERGPLEFREAYDIFLPIARSIEALHHAGLRHQDIKPDNIFLAKFAGRLHPVLLDLGVAAEKDSNFIAGTALYAAPEQLLAIIGVPGAIALTERMDTYCFAATLLMALVGEARFPGAKATTRDEIVLSHRDRATEPLRGCLPRLEGAPRDMLERKLCEWLALEPEDRPDINKVAEGLDVLLEPEREIERAEIAAKEAQRKSLARTRIGALVFFLVAASLGIFGFYKRQSLKLANDLERAQKEGARSFDKLDTCKASFDVERQEHDACEADRKTEREEYRTTLDAATKKDSNSAALAAQFEKTQTRIEGDLSTCREDLRTARDELRTEHATNETEKTKASEECTADKKAIETKVTTCEQGRTDDAAKALTAQTSCDTARTTCQTKLDACELLAPAPPSTGTGGGVGPAPHPPGTDTPPPSTGTIPSGSPPGTGTGAPTAPPTGQPTSTPPSTGTPPPTVPPPQTNTPPPPPPNGDPYGG